MNNDDNKTDAVPNDLKGNVNSPTSANREIRAPGPSFWSSRGYLPHFDDGDVPQHVTIHLADSLPRNVVERMAEEVSLLAPEKQDMELRKRIEDWLDAGHGSCILREPYVAQLVVDALTFFDCDRYKLIEWVVMPNHLHVLVQPLNGWKVKKIVASWKKFTASRILNFLRRRGDGTFGTQPVWHPEFWDRFVRNHEHFRQVVEYIRQNPVKARLCNDPENWQWSSARKAAEGEPPRERESSRERESPDSRSS